MTHQRDFAVLVAIAQLRAKTFPSLLYASALPSESLRISLAEPRRAMLAR